MIDMFEKHEEWLESGTRSHRVFPSLVVLGIGVVLLVVVLGIGVVLIISSRNGGATRLTVAEAVVGSNAVLLGDYPDGRAWLSLYRRNQDLLGEPVIGEHPFGNNPDCVTFTNFLVCRSQDPGVRGTQWEYPIHVLGTLSLPGGIAKEVDAPLSAAAKSYIDQAITGSGRDWLYWLGRPISRQFCPSDGGDCYQPFERQILRYPNRLDVGWRDVQLSPLGLSFGQ